MKIKYVFILLFCLPLFSTKNDLRREEKEIMPIIENIINKNYSFSEQDKNLTIKHNVLLKMPFAGIWRQKLPGSNWTYNQSKGVKNFKVLNHFINFKKVNLRAQGCPNIPMLKFWEIDISHGNKKEYYLYVQNIPNVNKDRINEVKEINGVPPATGFLGVLKNNAEHIRPLEFHLQDHEQFISDLTNIGDKNLPFVSPLDSININEKDSLGNTLLHTAVHLSLNNNETIQALLNNDNIDILIQDMTQKTSFYWSLVERKNDIANTLLEHLFSKHDKFTAKNLARRDFYLAYGDYPLHEMIQRRDIENLTLAMKYNLFDLNQINAQGETIFSIAAQLNDPEIIKILLDNNDFFNLFTPENIKPLI